MRNNFQIKIFLILIFGLIVGPGVLYWMCRSSDKIAFLCEKPGAEWVVYPNPPDAGQKQPLPLVAIFRRDFKLDELFPQATLSICAFKNYAIFINGQRTGNPPPQNWKSTSTLDITYLLHAGTNEIAVYVMNSLGPPALWLHLQDGPFAFGTDKDWNVSQGGAEWQQALPASQLPELKPQNPLYGGENTVDSIMRIWPLLLIYCGVSLILVSLLRRWSRNMSPADLTRYINGLLILVIIARIALFINDAPQLSQDTGFDGQAHEQYIQFIQEKKALPHPADGWEMYQPPLYYLISAGWLDAFGLKSGQNDSRLTLRTINCVIGVAQCILSLLCLRLLFPKNAGAQAAGLLTVAFLPPDLCLSLCVTNEPLTGLLVTGALYFFLRILQSDNERTMLYLGLGATLGAALLTKSSALPMLPFLAGILALRLRNHSFRNWARLMGMMICPCVVICGWYYSMVWLHYGKFVLGNWDTDSPFLFWQYPGYRTAGYFFHFGRVLNVPLFSGFWGFGDGLFSTLWGDGLVSGENGVAFRPPWNYDLMDSGYLFSVPISLFLMFGFVISLIKFTQNPRFEWGLMLGTILIFGVAILFMALRVPSYAEVKAFYASPALFPFSALVAAGWDWFKNRKFGWRIALWVVLGAWTMTVYTSFWIRSGNPQTYFYRSQIQLGNQEYTESAQNSLMAAQLAEASPYYNDEPDLRLLSAEAHYYSGIIDHLHWNDGEAIMEYQKALEANRDFPDALDVLAWALATSSDPSLRDGPKAMQLAEHACELTQYGDASIIDTLAAADAEAGHFDEAVAAIQRAIYVAQQNNDKGLVEVNEQFLELYRAHKPYHQVALVPAAK